MTGEVYPGILLAEGALDWLVAYPPAKAPAIKISWNEEEGAEISDEPPTADKKKADIRFLDTGGGAKAFIDYLMERERRFTFAPLPDAVTLRVLSFPHLVYDPHFTSFSIRFEEVGADFPSTKAAFHPVPVRGSAAFLLDGVNVNRYGVHILEGSLDSLLRGGDAKPGLVGAVKRKREAYEATLHCHIGATGGAFFENRNAFLQALTARRVHTLTLPTGETMQSYYRDCTTREFFHDPRYWWTFDLKMMIIKRSYNS